MFERGHEALVLSDVIAGLGAASDVPAFFVYGLSAYSYDGSPRGVPTWVYRFALQQPSNQHSMSPAFGCIGHHLLSLPVARLVLRGEESGSCSPSTCPPAFPIA